MKKKPKEITDSIDIELPYDVERKFDKVDLENFKDTVVYEYLKIFSDTLLQRVNNDDLTCFYNNINRLTVVKTNLKNEYVRGTYDPNNIIVVGSDYKETIFHELTHMASTKVSKDTIYNGFVQLKKGKIIGLGLTEGYTQLETKRNFGEYGVLDAYGLLSYYCELLEGILGENFVKRCYYNADLYTLVDELKKYTRIDEIMKFLNDMDYLKKVLYSKKNQFKNKFIAKRIVLTIKRINAFLLKIFMITLLRYKDKGLIDESKYNELLVDFVNGLVHGIEISNKNYEIYPEELDKEFKELLDDVIEQISFERVLKK